jgi:hypothetical protein
MMTSIKFIYILQKKYINYSQILYDRKPVCGSEDYELIIDRAKRDRDYILKHNDSWFDDVDTKQEPLVAWNGINYFAVGTSDRRLRIAFSISVMPLLTNDTSE